MPKTVRNIASILPVGDRGLFPLHPCNVREKNVSLSKRLFSDSPLLSDIDLYRQSLHFFSYISSESFQAFQTQFTDVCVGKSFEMLTRKSFDRM